MFASSVPIAILWPTSGGGWERERERESKSTYLQMETLRLQKPTYPTDNHTLRNGEVWPLCTIPKENPAWQLGSAMPRRAG